MIEVPRSGRLQSRPSAESGLEYDLEESQSLESFKGRSICGACMILSLSGRNPLPPSQVDFLEHFVGLVITIASQMAINLSEYPIKFPPLVQATGVYFDDVNKQIFVTRDGVNSIDIISITPYSETSIRYEQAFHLITADSRTPRALTL